MSLKPYLCSSRRIRSIKPVGLSIQKIKFGQIINGSSGFLPLLQFLQNHLILISEKINRHQTPQEVLSKYHLNGIKSIMNFLKTWIVSLNILPNCLQNDQIHVTDDRGIVLMRNLLAPPSSFGICAGFLFVFLSLLSLQSALSRHSVQDIWELDKPQTLGNESFIQKVFKL